MKNPPRLWLAERTSEADLKLSDTEPPAF